MKQIYDQEFNRSFPVPTEGEEFSPPENKRRKRRKKLATVLLLTTLVSTASKTKEPEIRLGDMSPNSVELFVIDDLKSQKAGEAAWYYLLMDEHGKAEEGKLSSSGGSIVIPNLQPDTEYSLSLRQGTREKMKIQFKTPEEEQAVP